MSQEVPNSRPKVILIDDDPTLGRAIDRMLSKQFEVRVLTNGVELKPALDEFKPDLIIFDLGLPWIDGEDLCRMIRCQNSYKTTPIIFLTGHQNFIDVMGMMEAGANACLMKPLRLNELEKNIERLLTPKEPVSSCVKIWLKCCLLKITPMTPNSFSVNW